MPKFNLLLVYYFISAFLWCFISQIKFPKHFLRYIINLYNNNLFTTDTTINYLCNYFTMSLFLFCNTYI